MNTDVPKESETIAARRAARLADKIRKSRRELIVTRAWWSNRVTDFLSLLLILIINIYLISPSFGTAAAPTTFSGPVIPLLARAIELTNIEIGQAFQIVNIVFFLLLPISFYLFVKRVSGRRLVAVLAATFVSLPIYPFARTRVEVGFLGIESPHIASLAIMPMALYGLLSFLRQGGIVNLVISCVSSSLVALTSPFGFMTYGLFSAITGFSEMLLGGGRLKIYRLVIVFLLAAGLSSFWYNPAFFLWMLTGPLGGVVRQTFARLFPISFFLLPILGAFGYLLFDRKPELQSVFLASFYTILFGIIVLAGGGFFPSHPSRYTPELGIALSFLLAIGSVKLIDFLRFKKKFKISKFGGQALANAALFLLAIILLSVIILAKGSLFETQEDILGLWTDINKGEIWVERDKFSGTFGYFGYAITGLSILFLGFLGAGTKEERDLLSRQQRK